MHRIPLLYKTVKKEKTEAVTSPHWCTIVLRSLPTGARLSKAETSAYRSGRLQRQGKDLLRRLEESAKHGAGSTKCEGWSGK